AAEVEAVFRGGGIDTRHQRDTATGQLGNRIEELFALAVAEGVVLACGTADDQTVDAVADQAVDHRGQGSEVDGTLLGERGNNGGPDTIKVHVITWANKLYLLGISR